MLSLGGEGQGEGEIFPQSSALSPDTFHRLPLLSSKAQEGGYYNWVFKKLFAVVMVAVVLGVLVRGWVAPLNSGLPGVRVSVMGTTNVGGVPNLMMQFPKVLDHKMRVPFGHKGLYLVKLNLNCTLRDGSLTNYFWSDAVAAHLDGSCYLPLPRETKEVRVVRAEGNLRSFEDVRLPGFEFPTLDQKFRYAVPEETFEIKQ
jgi:hypothetical protein